MYKIKTCLFFLISSYFVSPLSCGIKVVTYPTAIYLIFYCNFVELNHEAANTSNILYCVIKFHFVYMSSGPAGTAQPSAPDSGPIKATPSMWRCSHIMRMQRDIHPTILSSLEGVVDQVGFSYSFYTSIFKCYVNYMHNIFLIY